MRVRVRAFVRACLRATVSVRVHGCACVLGAFVAGFACACVLLLGARAGFARAGCVYRGACACHVKVYCEQNQRVTVDYQCIGLSIDYVLR